MEISSMKIFKGKIAQTIINNSLLFISVFVTLKVLLAIVFSIVLSFVEHESLGGPSFGSPLEQFILAVCVGPFFETYLCQYMPFHYLLKYMRPRAVILLSALFFGSFHLAYSPLYFVFTFLGGLLFSTAFYLRLHSRPLLHTTIIHACYNLIGLIDNWLNPI
jgi:membrane protease YdiL (CAAX protease family)